ncbi:MAG: hypothetical protein MUC87_18510 [Bacteroidia bacterium]|jgi:hypothetical protein|nr:hypothetical protein [Bacteroidia bacterium]
MSTTTLSTKPPGQFNDSLNSFNNVGLLLKEGSVTSVTYSYSGKSVGLTLDKNISVNIVGIKSDFSFNIDNVPAIELYLNDAGNPVINGSSEWTQVSGTTNRFTYSGQLFNVHILLSNASDTQIMEIILIGTVPTEDDKR